MHFPSHWPFLVSPGWAAPAVSSEDLHQAENSDNRREKLRKANKRGIGGRGEKRCLRRRITCWVNGGIRVKGKCEKNVYQLAIFWLILTERLWEASGALACQAAPVIRWEDNGQDSQHRAMLPDLVTGCSMSDVMWVKGDAVWCLPHRVLRKWSLSLPNPLLSAAIRSHHVFNWLMRNR